MSSTKQALSIAQALTTSLTASTNTSITEGYNYHTLELAWTPGTSGNILTVTIEHRALNAVTNGPWTQDMKWNESPAGTLTRQVLQLKETATGTTELGLYYTFPNHGDEYRIKVAESEDGSSTKGTLSAWLTSSNS